MPLFFHPEMPYNVWVCYIDTGITVAVAIGSTDLTEGHTSDRAASHSSIPVEIVAHPS
jgi:hypothetical protein